MSKAGNDVATPAPLMALGGWDNADWFCPTVLLDNDVVGFSLPELRGRRKQSFRVVERLLADGAAAKKPAGKNMRQLATGIGPTLDRIGATNIAAFRRTTFLFESAAVLYFANIPAGHLKIRSANRLRRDLLESRFRGCVLRIDGGQVMAMFWPNAELAITGFITAATPQYALHAEFDEAELEYGDGKDAPPSKLKGKGKSTAAPEKDRSSADHRSSKRHDAQERRNLHRERQALLAEVAALRGQIDKLQGSQSTLGAMEKLGLDDARLKSMLTLLHPDKHGNSESANDAAKWVNNLRDLLKRKT